MTLEDILEEIVGDITDEHDVAMPGVRRQPDGSVNVDGAVPIRDFNRVMDWNLPDEEATTIAGLVIHEARSIPEVGQSFTFHGFRFRVLRRARNRITALRIQPLTRMQRARSGLNAFFARRGGVDGERVHTAGELGRKQLVNHTVTFEPGLSFERFRHDIHAVVSLPARPVSGMAFMLVGFVKHLQALRRESLDQLFCDEIGGPHSAPLRRGRPAGQWPESCLQYESSLEGVTGKSA